MIGRNSHFGSKNHLFSLSLSGVQNGTRPRTRNVDLSTLASSECTEGFSYVAIATTHVCVFVGAIVKKLSVGFACV